MTGIAELADPPSPNGKEVLTPATRSAWRSWLASVPERKEGLWVVYRKKSSDLEGPLYDDLVEEALCFGWIDSLTRRVDDDRMIQWYSPRRRGGQWSASNKERIERLMAYGRMTAAGQRLIDQAKADGSWRQSDEVEALVVPSDLATALNAAPRARAGYESLPDSQKKQILWAIHGARRAATRAARIEETVRTLSEAVAG
jgi:uncharacterized protein YdeI (YjbR/CyaY-like superfamily)